MTLTQEEVKHIARLAQLALREDEEPLYQEQLSAILDYVDQLRTLENATTSPTATVFPTHNVLRNDECMPPLSQAEALTNAPVIKEGCFFVPPVREKE